MKHALVVLALVIGIGCADDPPTAPTTITNINTNTNIQGGSSTGTGGAECPLVDNLGTSARLGGSEVGQAKVGDVLGLDVTPKAGSVPVDAQCHAATAVWSVSTPLVCELIGNATGFNPGLLLKAAGTCSVSVNVGGVQGGLSVNVTP